MPTSSITHNFVIRDRDSAERLAEALDMPKIQKSDIKVETISGAENVRTLVNKWKASNRQISIVETKLDGTE